MKRAQQEVIHETRHHDGYPDSHEPIHRGKDCCPGCDERRDRMSRNRSAARLVGIELGKDEKAGACKVCEAPVYAAKMPESQIPIWAWNKDVDRQRWGVEQREGHRVPTFCPSCRPSA